MPLSAYDMVVVVSGHMTDAPDRKDRRFPEAFVPGVTEAVDEVLDRWDVGPHSLCVSGGARGADIVVAERCQARGAAIRLLLVFEDEEFIGRSVRSPGTDWEARYRALRATSDARSQPEALGPLPDGENMYVRNNAWTLAEAREAAAGAPIRALLVWDGCDPVRPGGTHDFARQAEAAGVEVVVIHPEQDARRGGGVLPSA